MCYDKRAKGKKTVLAPDERRIQMARTRLTWEEKKIRRELNKYHRNLPEQREKRKIERRAFLLALLLSLPAGKDSKKGGF